MKMINLICDDCEKALKTLSDNSVDALVTDPPAAINFMNVEWDSKKGGKTHWINWLKQIMIESLRIVKPGSYGMVWALPKTSHWTANAIEDANWNIIDILHHHFGSGFPKHKNLLKPSTEHWILCQKSISETNIEKNVKKWGTGLLNIDKCRIEYKNDIDKKMATPQGKCTSKNLGAIGATPDAGRKIERIEFQRPELKGRHPSNVLLTHSANCDLESNECEPDCPIQKINEPVGIKKSGSNCVRRNESVFYNHKIGKPGDVQTTYGDEGYVSRYFKILPPVYFSKPGQKEKNAGLPVKNAHLTVKSLDLMRYICRLVCPEKGTILDPFIGSGTTAIACICENSSCIGIDNDKSYINIANLRISNAKKATKKADIFSSSIREK